MKKIIFILSTIILVFSSNIIAAEKLSIEKQLIGIVGATSGIVKTETRELKPGDKIYLKKKLLVEEAKKKGEEETQKL